MLPDDHRTGRTERVKIGRRKLVAFFREEPEDPNRWERFSVKLVTSVANRLVSNAVEKHLLVTAEKNQTKVVVRSDPAEPQLTNVPGRFNPFDPFPVKIQDRRTLRARRREPTQLECITTDGLGIPDTREQLPSIPARSPCSRD